MNIINCQLEKNHYHVNYIEAPQIGHTSHIVFYYHNEKLILGNFFHVKLFLIRIDISSK